MCSVWLGRKTRFDEDRLEFHAIVAAGIDRPDEGFGEDFGIARGFRSLASIDPMDEGKRTIGTGVDCAVDQGLAAFLPAAQRVVIDRCVVGEIGTEFDADDVDRSCEIGQRAVGSTRNDDGAIAQTAQECGEP